MISLLCGAARAQVLESPQIVEQEPFYYLAIPGRGPLKGIPAAIAEASAQMKAQRITANGPLMVFYRDKPGIVPPGQLRWDVGYPVDEAEAAKGDRGKLMVFQFNHPRVARGIHRGSYLTTTTSIATLKLFVLRRGFTTENGPVVEQYLPVSATTPDDQKLTRILLPVREPYLGAATPFNYLCLTGTSPDFSEAVARFRFLMQWYRVCPEGPVFVIRSAPGAPSSWQVGQAVSADQPAIGQLSLKRFTYPLLASVVHNGPYASTGEALGALEAWATDRGYAAYGAPSMEFYLDREPDGVPDADKRTVVSLAITTRPGSGDRAWPIPCAPWKIVEQVPDVPEPERPWETER